MRINIFVYYILTVSALVGVNYYFLEFVTYKNSTLFFIFLACLLIISGVFISKLAVDPLEEYIRHLQALSKETLHELNLPISTIKNNTQLLKRKQHDPKTLKRIGRIEEACAMLQERYKELDYAIKMQSDGAIYEEFEISELIESRVEFLQALYPDVVFHLSLEKDVMMLDKIGLAKVIDNIIENGVKYSNEKPKIDITYTDAKLSIKDYGIGMDEVELMKIFDEYYQVNHTMQGFGIGLSMVKRYCDKNKIQLRFESQKGVGTCVHLELKNKG